MRSPSSSGGSASRLWRRGRARRLQALGLAAATGITLLVSGAPSASALAGFHTSAASVRVRQSPDTGSAQVGIIAASGTAIDINCQIVAQSVTASGFGTSTIWDRLNGYSNGYISDLFVKETAYAQRDSRLPSCPTGSTGSTPTSTAQMLAAAQWAISEKNSPDPTWSDRYHHAWSGWCEQFVEQAEGYKVTFTTATAHYQWQLGQRRIHTDTNPPVGAVVFWNGGSNGHTAISIGNGQAVGTYGDGVTPGYTRLPVRQYPVVGFLKNTYLGWANPIGS